MAAAWIGFAVFVAVALMLDLRGHGGRKMSTRTALVWSIGWTAIGLAFAGVVLLIQDGAAASEYLAGFLIEKSLSLDNLFVFAILFTFFEVPDDAAPEGAGVGHRGRDRAAHDLHPRRRRRARRVPRRRRTCSARCCSFTAIESRARRTRRSTPTQRS